jgi:hypothetical protein
MTSVDAMLAQLGAKQRIFALASHESHRRVFLVITPDQRRALVVARVEGIHAGPRT